MTVIVGPKGQRYGIDRKSWPLAGAVGSTNSLIGSYGRSGRSSLDMIGWGRAQSYGSLYRSQLWVNAACNKLSRGVARLPLKTFEWEDEEAGDRRRVRDHPLPRLLSNPWPRASGRDLKENIVGHCAVYGNALLAKWRPGPGRPVEELWPIPWRYVNVITGRDVPILAYEFSGPGKRLVFLPEDVIHFRWWGPDGDGCGVSPLEPLAETVALEDAAKRYAISSFANAARPAGAFVTTNTLRPDKKKELEDQLGAVWSGPDNAFKTLLLDAGLDWKTISFNAEQQQMVETRKLSREEVCAAYDIPPPMLQILDRATFSNIEEQHRMLYQDTLGPWLSMIEETFEAQLLRDETAFSGVFIEFDLSEVLKGDPAARAEAYSKLLTSGVYTINELRALENLPRIDHPLADAVFVPLNYSPVAEGMDGEAADSEAAQAALARIEANRLALVGAVLGLKEKNGNGNGNGHLDGADLEKHLRDAGLTAIESKLQDVSREVIELGRDRSRPATVEVDPQHNYTEVTVDSKAVAAEISASIGRELRLIEELLSKQVQDATRRVPVKKLVERDHDGLVTRVVQKAIDTGEVVSSLKVVRDEEGALIGVEEEELTAA